MRLSVVPFLLPPVFGRAATRRLAFRTVSQIGIRYPHSALSAGRAGSVSGGDRLPWLPADESAATGADNHAPLAGLDWQVHVYGSASPALQTACARLELPLHVFTNGGASDPGGAGLRRDALYLVRPDSYVAWADDAADPGRLEGFLDRHHVRGGIHSRNFRSEWKVG